MKIKNVISLFVVLNLVSCNIIDNIWGTSEPEESTTTKVSVSFISSSSNRSVNSRSLDIPQSYLSTRNLDDNEDITYIIDPLENETYFKDEFKVENRGQLVKVITPKSFVISTSNLFLYKDVFKSGEENISRMVNSYGIQDTGEIYKHYDIINSKQVVKEFTVNGDQFSGFGMSLNLNWDFNDSSLNDGLMTASEVVVDLGVEYNNVVLDGSLIEEGYHKFLIRDLQPYITEFLQYFAIGSQITEDGIQNPYGGDGPYPIPCLIEQSGSGIYQQSSIFLNGPDYDFSNFENPEIIFNWDLNDFIQVYDNNTPEDLSDDIVTFDLERPFPISITVQELEELSSENIVSSDLDAPNEVTYAHMGGRESINTIQWVNPIDDDFKEVKIIRKIDSQPSGYEDGELVYQGYIPMFFDISGVGGTHYYYLIYTEDYSGNRSEGLILDQVQFKSVTDDLSGSNIPPGIIY